MTEEINGFIRKRITRQIRQGLSKGRVLKTESLTDKKNKNMFFTLICRFIICRNTD